MRTYRMVVAAVIGLAGCGQVSTDEAQPTPTALPTATTLATTSTISAAARGQATSGLCADVRAVNATAVVADRFVGARARLGSSIAANEAAADPAVLSSVRALHAAVLASSLDGYVDGFNAAAKACAAAGYSVHPPPPPRGARRCVTTPC